MNIGEVGKIENSIICSNFLKEPLKLKMFIPCDCSGNVLEFVNLYHEIKHGDEEHKDWLWEKIIDFYEKSGNYKSAFENVLFKGFRYDTEEEYVYLETPTGTEIIGLCEFDGYTIEDLSPDYELTESTIKDLELCQ